MKYAIVTGGARGLGLGIVRSLLDDKVADQVAVSFLCSERAMNITGHVMVVDGGIVLGPPRLGP